MLRSALVALAFIAGRLPSFACDNCLDPKVHRLCLDAQDYPSCVEKMKVDAATAANGDSQAEVLSSMRETASRVGGTLKVQLSFGGL